MVVPQWNPRLELTKREKLIVGQLERIRKLLPFLWRQWPSPPSITIALVC